MITAANLEETLQALGFQKNGDIYGKTYPSFPCTMQVDFLSQKLIFPDAIHGRERNDGFDHAENFVVFECVDRLLEKGYRPEHITLEKTWRFGHDPKGGRADICISAPDGSMLAIIECKKYGKEFEKAFRDTNLDGGQIFSYWQQERHTKWLVLYASDLKDGSVVYKAPTWNCSDDPNIVELAKKDKRLLLYSEAGTAEEKFKVWKETYGGQIYDDLMFSADSVAYQIGIKPLRKKDLKDFSPEDKIVNKFEEILRHNNVSDKENAFNRLIALFICKLVDESMKSDEDTVEFQYKQGTDTYETLQDRLQHLHQEGMEKFMREKIMYVPADYPEWLFNTYTGQQRKQAVEDLKEKIRILKFYSNNDFSFKDVHNEELFFQNGKILVEVVRLFEHYRIVYPSKHQFLGDLFEQLLNKGFKQNEGQFFTPIPIARFMWDCLPLQSIMKTERGHVYPKIIDYACGAGHFLTEAVEAVNACIENSGDNSWARDCIYGIEKDYRLARVSKISLFMNGAGEGNIIFGDGLENVPEKQIEPNSFDILIANPPYSVAAFKQHLQLKNNKFELLERIGDSGSEIEVLFVERIAQLLKPNGIAAVILPSSILSNDSASYTGAREQLLKNFLIRAIVQLGSKTFGATGTNTVIMFLQKYHEPPKKRDLIADSVQAILGGKPTGDWKDENILEGYSEKIGLTEEQYRSFIDESSEIETLSKLPYFKLYTQMFFASAQYRKLCASKQFMKKTEAERTEEIKRKFYIYAKRIEGEKLFYFGLTMEQRTLVITAPADNHAQKEFLGYDWSNRKGAEGIQIIRRGGNLYDDADRKAEGTLAAAVRAVFRGEIPVLTAENQQYAAVFMTKDLIDFSRLNFNKALYLNKKEGDRLKSKYPIFGLGAVAEVISGQSPKSEFYNKEGKGLPFYQGKKEFGEKVLLEPSVWTTGVTKESVKDDILMSVRAPVGSINLNPFDKICIGRGLAAIRSAKKELLQAYLYLYLYANQTHISGHDGATFDSISGDEVKAIPVPVPPVSVQRKIISESAKIDKEYQTTRMTPEEYRGRLENLFSKLSVAVREIGEEVV